MEFTIEGFPADFALKQSWDLIIFMFFFEKNNFLDKTLNPCRDIFIIFMEQIGWVLKIRPFVDGTSTVVCLY